MISLHVQPSLFLEKIHLASQKYAKKKKIIYKAVKKLVAGELMLLLISSQLRRTGSYTRWKGELLNSHSDISP